MNNISEAELFRRTKLIRDIRESYINKYGIKDEEVKYSFTFQILKNLDKAEYIRVDSKGYIRYGKYTDTKTVTSYDPCLAAKLNTGEIQSYWGKETTIHGRFERELDYFKPSDRYLQEDCTDKEIKDIEKENFKGFIGYLTRSKSHDIEYKNKQLNELKEQVTNMQNRLDYINKINDELRND